MSSLPILPGVAVLALSGALSTQNLLGPDLNAPASPQQVEDLAQLVAVCPDLASSVARQLDSLGGELDARSAQHLIEANRSCYAHYRQLPAADRYRLAYASLRSVIAADQPYQPGP